MSEQFTNVMTEEEAAEMILNLFKPATVRKQVMKLIKKLDGTTYPVGLDVGVYCMWLAVAMYPEMLKEELRNFVPSVMDFDRIKALFLSGITVPSSPEAIARIGAEKIALQQMSYSGLGQMASGPQGGRAQINGGIASRWNVDSICKRIDLLSPLLKRVRITNLDFETLLLDQRRSTVYLDPPYFDVGEKLYLSALAVSRRSPSAKRTAAPLGS